MCLAGPGDPEVIPRWPPLGARRRRVRKRGRRSRPPGGQCWDRGGPEAGTPQAETPSPPGYPPQTLAPSEERKRKWKEGKQMETSTPLSRAPPDRGAVGAAAVAAEAEAELRTRAQSWASPPATRGWLSRCGQHPRQTGPWGQRRSACHPRTGSRRAPTGPRWKADGNGGGTHGRCSHGRPGRGTGKGTVRDARAGGAVGLTRGRPSRNLTEAKPATLTQCSGSRKATSRAPAEAAPPPPPPASPPPRLPAQPGAIHGHGAGSSDPFRSRIA